MNTIHQGDCIAGLQGLAEGIVDLAFADPPFNIGYEYDVYEDRREYREYLSWTKHWMAAVCRALKPNGTFWVAIGDEYAAEIKQIAQSSLGLACRSWVIWYYTFGVNCTENFSRSHTHLFHFVKDPKNYTFNDQEIRIPSARQLVYADGRANPSGRLPDNTWVLRPQDVAGAFNGSENTWYFPRVAGTFKERAGFHGCQMPEQLLGRIIRSCSNPDELVLDPFTGSGTTLSVAKKLGRKWLGFELSPEYAKKAADRIKNATVGEPLEGAPEPTVSAPPTGKSSSRIYLQAGVERALIEAFVRTAHGFSVDRLVADPEMNAQFIEECGQLGLPGDACHLNKALMGLRKAGKLESLPRAKETTFKPTEQDKYLDASGLAMSQLYVEHQLSLDDVLCDPKAASKFDKLAGGFAPGFTSLQYRWAALRIRKRAKDNFRGASKLLRSSDKLVSGLEFHLSESLQVDHLARQPGVYLIRSERDGCLFVGSTLDLRDRAEQTKERVRAWRSLNGKPEPQSIRIMELGNAPPTARFTHQYRLILELNPKFNRFEHSPQ